MISSYSCKWKCFNFLTVCMAGRIGNAESTTVTGMGKAEYSNVSFTKQASIKTRKYKNHSQIQSTKHYFIIIHYHSLVHSQLAICVAGFVAQLIGPFNTMLKGRIRASANFSRTLPRLFSACQWQDLSFTYQNQSTESTDGDGCI